MFKCVHCSYEVMRKCWEEKFEKRPEFSYLVQEMGNMLTEGYKKVFPFFPFFFLGFHTSAQVKVLVVFIMVSESMLWANWKATITLFLFLFLHLSLSLLLQRYSQVNENFQKSDHPAVVRGKPRVPSPFPGTLPPSSPSTIFPPSSTLRRCLETDQEVDPETYNGYIIPIPDPKPEEECLEVSMPTESPSR